MYIYQDYLSFGSELMDTATAVLKVLIKMILILIRKSNSLREKVTAKYWFLDKTRYDVLVEKVAHSYTKRWKINSIVECAASSFD